MRKAERQKLILVALKNTFGELGTALHYTTPFELLIAVILSAQCTDERVNKITARLFPRYQTPALLGALKQEELEKLIHDCGLFRAKARNILGTCRLLEQEYAGQLPTTLEQLVQLPGVGRKTANVMLSVAFGQPALAVDTHVFRVAKRLGLAQGEDVLSVEQELMRVVPREQWGQAHHWMIWQGRRVCKARKPLCASCCVLELCPYRGKNL